MLKVIFLLVALYKINAYSVVKYFLRTDGDHRIKFTLEEFKNETNFKNGLIDVKKEIIFECVKQNHFPRDVMKESKKPIIFDFIQCNGDNIVSEIENETAGNWKKTKKHATTKTVVGEETVYKIKCEENDNNIKLIGENMDNGKDINLCEPANILL